MGIPDSGKVTLTVSTIILVLAFFAVALRFWVRWITKVGISSDDWWILIGISLSMITGSTLLYGIVSDPEGGEMIDRDSPTFNYEPHVTYLKVSYSIAMLYFSLISAVKISIVLMYRRIFSTPSFRLHSLILAVCVFFWWITGTVTTGVYCVPLERYWVGPSVGGYCYNYNIFWMVMGVLEVIIDAVILVLPIRMVLQLRLTRQSKILIIGIFLLGSFVLITGVLRVIYGYKPGSTNISFEKGEMWSAVHVGTAVICACLPTLRPLFMIGARAILCNRARGYGSGSRTGSARDNTWYHRKSRSARQSVSARSKDATRKSGDKYSQKGIMTLIGDQESLKPTASDDIIVEERMDTEWSRSPSGAGSHDDIGLVQVEKAHIRR